jgi:hypothetical protein
VYRELHGRVVLVDLENDRIYALNETGARLWELLAAGRSRTEIRDKLLEEFDVDPAELDGEIDSLLADLQAAGLVS